MIKDKAYGVIPFCKEGDTFRVLLVRHAEGGHWSFPKGHADPGETPYQTALREFEEETGVATVDAVFDRTLSEGYEFERGDELVQKEVEYFICYISCDTSITLQSEEVSAHQWLTQSDVAAFDIFTSKKKLLIELFMYLESVDIEEKR